MAGFAKDQYLLTDRWVPRRHVGGASASADDAHEIAGGWCWRLVACERTGRWERTGQVKWTVMGRRPPHPTDTVKGMDMANDN